MPDIEDTDADTDEDTTETLLSEVSPEVCPFKEKIVHSTICIENLCRLHQDKTSNSIMAVKYGWILLIPIPFKYVMHMADARSATIYLFNTKRFL